MKDHFLEEVVIKQKNVFNRILYYFSWVVIVFSGLYAVIMFSSISRSLTTGGFNIQALLLFLICGGICGYTFFIHDRFLTEYEYTFTNGALDFAEVYNNKKRKTLGSLNVRNVECFGKVNSEKFKRYMNMPDIKRMNWFLNREADLYFFFFSKDNSKKMIILEPSEEMVGYIKQYLPRGVWQE